jgi:hypothetical protein
MKAFCKKLANLFSVIFGYGIMISLFGGGLTFFGFVAALIIGGDTEAEICAFIKDKIFPVIIYLSTSMVILGLVAMYLNGETALTPDKKKSSKERL